MNTLLALCNSQINCWCKKNISIIICIFTLDGLKLFHNVKFRKNSRSKKEKKFFFLISSIFLFAHIWSQKFSLNAFKHLFNLHRNFKSSLDKFIRHSYKTICFKQITKKDPWDIEQLITFLIFFIDWHRVFTNYLLYFFITCAYCLTYTTRTRGPSSLK